MLGGIRQAANYRSQKKFNRKTRKQRQLPGESGFVLSIAPPPLSRDRRIKMKKSINHFTIMYNCSKGVPQKRIEKLFVNFTADTRCRTKQVKQKLMSRFTFLNILF